MDSLEKPPLLDKPTNLLVKPLCRLTRDDLSWVRCIYHLAAAKNVPESFAAPMAYAADAAAAQHLLDLAVRCKVSRIVVASSCEVYGNASVVPTAEDSPLGPRSPYAMSKAAIEMLARMYQFLPSTRITIVRLFNVYGPGERPDAVVPRFCKELLTKNSVTIEGSGNQAHDFSYVDDVVWQLQRIATLREPPSIVNVGSGRSTSIRALARMIIRIHSMGKIRFGPARIAEIPDFRANTSLAVATLGRPRRTPLETGLRLTYEWWRSRIASSSGCSAGPHDTVTSYNFESIGSGW